MKKISAKHKKEAEKAVLRKLRDKMYYRRGGINALDKIFESLSSKDQDAVTCLECVGQKYSFVEKWKGMVYREKLEALINLITK